MNNWNVYGRQLLGADGRARVTVIRQGSKVRASSPWRWKLQVRHSNGAWMNHEGFRHGQHSGYEATEELAVGKATHCLHAYEDSYNTEIKKMKMAVDAKAEANAIAKDHGSCPINDSILKKLW